MDTTQQPGLFYCCHEGTSYPGSRFDFRQLGSTSQLNEAEKEIDVIREHIKSVMIQIEVEESILRARTEYLERQKSKHENHPARFKGVFIHRFTKEHTSLTEALKSLPPTVFLELCTWSTLASLKRLEKHGRLDSFMDWCGSALGDLQNIPASSLERVFRWLNERGLRDDESAENFRGKSLLSRFRCSLFF